MGAAVSVAVTKMPDSLDEATLKKICGARFDKQKFDELKSADGFLSKTDLLEELSKPEYIIPTTTKKLKTLRSSFDQLLSENLSTSQKAKFIRKSFKATVPAGVDTDEDSNLPVDTNKPEGEGGSTDVIVEVDGIAPEHLSASSEKSMGEDDEWRLMTEPQRSQRAARVMADLARGAQDTALINELTPVNTTTNGIGVFRWGDQGQYYAGEWKDGKQNGNGVMRFPNGGVYEGEWKDGKMNGLGIYRGVDGDLYEGECIDDKRFGFGVFRFPDGKTYEGEWVKDKVHGGGILRSPEGIIIDD